MSEENRAPEDVQPLARAVNEPQLARPVVEEAQPEASQEPEEEQKEEQKEEQGPLGEAADKAVEKGLVDQSTVDKAEEVIDKVKNKLTGR